jgi:hypothetical protein
MHAAGMVLVLLRFFQHVYIGASATALLQHQQRQRQEQGQGQRQGHPDDWSELRDLNVELSMHILRYGKLLIN